MAKWIPIAMLVVLAGCTCEAPPPPPAPPPPVAPPTPIAAGRAIATRAAFDLAPTTDGAALVYGAPQQTGGGVFAQRLGPRGQALEVERAITPAGSAEARPSPAIEVVVAADGAHVGAAWVLDQGRAAITRAAFSPDGARRFRAVEELGESVRGHAGARGRLAISAPGGAGRLWIHHRVPEAACVAVAGASCARVGQHLLGAASAPDDRAGSYSEVPSACEPFVVGSIHRVGSAFSAMCTRRPEPTTYVLVLDPDPQLATPVDVAPGCTPVGLAPVDEGVAAVTDCASRTFATVIGGQGQVLGRLEDATASVRCEDGRPVLALADEDGETTLRLGPAIAGLAPLLPAAIAPPGARAIWTGEALLVGAPVGAQELELRRYECVDRGRRFDRTDVW